MVVERHLKSGAEKMTIMIISPEGHKDLISATDEICEDFYQLADCFAANGNVLRNFVYRTDWMQMISENLPPSSSIKLSDERIRNLGDSATELLNC